MDAGLVVLIVFGMFFLTILIVAAMLLRMYVKTESSEK